MKLVDMRGLKPRPLRVLVRLQARVLSYRYGLSLDVSLTVLVRRFSRFIYLVS